MAEWRVSTWGDEISLEYGKAIRGYSKYTGQYQVFGSNGQIGWTSAPLAAGPGVILGRKGAYRGVRFSREPFFVIDTAYYVAPKTDLDMRWLYYAIIHHKLGEIDDGSPIPSTTRSAVYVRDVEIPPLDEQRAIASILGALDDKIELNRRMNETLEAMARAIFKDWFVDFGPTRAKIEGRTPYLTSDLWKLFPDHFDAVGKPLGYCKVTVAEIAERIAMGPFGSNIKVSTFVERGMPIISGQHLNGLLLEDGKFNFITEDHAKRLSNSIVQRGDIVFTHAGNIGQVSIIPETSLFHEYVISQRQFFLRCNLDRVSSIFMIYFFQSAEGQHKLLANASQVGVPSISRPSTNLKVIELILPTKPLIDAFNEFAHKVHLKIGKNRLENETLTHLRDLLLPKLMSGEIRIKDAEKIAEEVL